MMFNFLFYCSLIVVRSDNDTNPGLVLHGFSLAILCIFVIEVSGLNTVFIIVSVRLHTQFYMSFNSKGYLVPD